MATRQFIFKDCVGLLNNTVIGGTSYTDGASARLHVKQGSSSNGSNLGNTNGLLIETSGSSSTCNALTIATGSGNILGLTQAGTLSSVVGNFTTSLSATSLSSVDGYFTGTGVIKIPVGTTAQRPTAADGMLRLNTTTNQFEGYNNSNWQGLGGVIDVDQDTYVSTEKTSDDDTLFFYTNGTERMRILSGGYVGIGITTPNEALTVSGNLSASGTIYAD